MDPAAAPPVSATAAAAAPPVDPFLVEALQNPRHRLTVLRMELDIQKFMQDPGQQQFEFPHFPTSYLRLAAHRVAQHYGLQTMIQDNFLDAKGSIILVKKLVESRYPAVLLSDVPAKVSENDRNEQVKIVIKPRPGKASLIGTGELGSNHSSVRTVEERMEEYDKARARIFSSPNSPEQEDRTFAAPLDGKSLAFVGDESEGSRDSIMDLERTLSRDGATSQVAIFRDMEKDRADPDYDRSYERYVRNLPAGQSFSLMPVGLPKFQPCVQYDSVLAPYGQIPRTQASFGYTSPVMNPFATVGLNQTSMDAVYMQWPSHAMTYAHSYDQLRHAAFQATPFCRQPLSFDYVQHH